MSSGDKLARRRRRRQREAERESDREMRAALDELGEALLEARERGVPEALGFPTFAAWAREHIPAICPQWRLSPEQVDELASRAVKAAECRRRSAEVQRQAGYIGEILAMIDAERLYVVAGFDSLEDYARDRWGFDRRQVAVLLRAAEVKRQAAA